MRRLSFAGLLFFVLFLAGCETVKGVGKDLVSTSSFVQRSLGR